MSNKHPQYFTADGFKRSSKRPAAAKRKPIVTARQENGEKIPATLTLRTANAKRLLRRRYKAPTRVQGQGISPEAAKAIAAALTGLLHS